MRSYSALFAHFAQDRDDKSPHVYPDMDAPKLRWSHKCSAEQFGSLIYEVYNLAGDGTSKVVKVKNPTATCEAVIAAKRDLLTFVCTWPADMLLGSQGENMVGQISHCA